MSFESLETHNIFHKTISDDRTHNESNNSHPQYEFLLLE